MYTTNSSKHILGLSPTYRSNITVIFRHILMVLWMNWLVYKINCTYGNSILTDGGLFLISILKFVFTMLIQ